MLNKSIKIISIILLVCVAVMALSQIALATSGYDVEIKPTENEMGKNVATIMGKVLFIVQVVGMGVAVIMLVVLAIKYISAAPSDKAEIKKHAVVYVVGAVVLFGASGIIEIIKKFAIENVKAGSI